MKYLAIAAILLPLSISAVNAEDFETGGTALVPKVTTTVVTPTNVAAGIGNNAQQNVQGVGNNGVKVKIGPGGAVTTTVVESTNVAAGIGNTAGQNVQGIANGAPAVGAPTGPQNLQPVRRDRR
jgi:hypothetical protein